MKIFTQKFTEENYESISYFTLRYIQLLKEDITLPKPKQNVTISKWLNGQMHIYFNKQELGSKSLKDKPGKKGYKSRKVPINHPWRKMNQGITKDKRRNYLIAALG
jgi:hypothetical protein